jgi:hypothetical protein
MTMRRHIVTPGESLFRKNGLPTPSKMRKANRLVDTASDRLLDPNDPLHSAIEDMLAGLSSKERVKRLDELFPIKGIQ